MNAIPDALPPSARDDQIQPFLLESSGIRGRLLRLGGLGNTIVLRHDYPAPLARLLAEMLALSGALSSLLKYEGVFTAQAKGDGPVSLLVADVTAEGNLRGYASFDEDRLGELLNRDEAPSFQEMMGKGYFAYTVDLGSTQERYQGIVELKGERLSDCLQHYFLQSDQVQSGIVLSADFQLEAVPGDELREIIRQNLEWREHSHPDLRLLPSAGSIFQKIEGIGAGRLIDKCGLKGKVHPGGRAAIFDRHANIVVNLGGATARDVRDLIDLAQETTNSLSLGGR